MGKKWKRLTALAIAGAISAGIGAPGSPFGAVSTAQAGKISTEDKDVQYIQENLSEEVQYLDVNGEVNPDRIIEELAYDKKLIGCDITFKIKNPDQKSVAQAMLDYITEQFGTDDFNAVLADYVKQKYPQAAMESKYTFLADTAGTEWNPEVFKETVVYDAANSSGHCSLNICRNNSQQEIGSVSIYFTVEKEQTEAADKWVKKDGIWYYYNADGQVYTNQWIKSGSKWCYVDESGAAYAGKWAKIDGKWYYFNSSAYMLASQWIKSGSKWSYVNSGGAAYVNAWMKKNGTWYYFDANAYMLANKWLKSGNKWYYFDDNGMMTTGWVMTGGEWYYMGADGIMRTGWQKIGNNWYYMYENGAQASEVIVDGYYLKSNGVMVESPVASKGQKEKSGYWSEIREPCSSQTSIWGIPM